MRKGESANVIIHEDASPGWIENINFYASNASCKMKITRDQEFYEVWHLGHFEPAMPQPYCSIHVEVSLDPTSTEPFSLYNITINRIVIPELTEFIISVREVLYGKFGRIMDFYDYSVLQELLEQIMKEKGIKPKAKEEVKPTMRRYTK